MLLLKRYRKSRLVKPDSVDTSEMSLLERCSDLRLVNLGLQRAKPHIRRIARRSEPLYLEGLERCSDLRLVNLDSNDKSEILVL